MTVAELIAELTRYPSDAEVVVWEEAFLPAAPALFEGSNSPAAEWPLYPYVVVGVA